jgi:ubiquinol-cytochrome c reductase cytochrome b subunit
VLFGMIIGWPFLEQWVTGDKREHHLLQRPRNAPTRTAFLAAMVTVYGLLWAAGGNDILATHFHWSLNSITYFMRAAIFIVPPIVFYVTRRWCIGLQRGDNDLLLHGYETGIIMRSVEGGYSERHLPINPDRAYTLTARHRDQVHEIESAVDENGVAAPGSRIERIRAKLSRGMFADNVQKPTVEELEEARHHAEHTHELEAGLDHPASGHEFDDHALRDAEDVPLRQH